MADNVAPVPPGVAESTRPLTTDPMGRALESRVRAVLGRGMGAGALMNSRPGLGGGPIRRLPLSPSIRDFITDGSVPALCDELARLTGIPIWLRDRGGDVIVASDQAAELSQPPHPTHSPHSPLPSQPLQPSAPASLPTPGAPADGAPAHSSDKPDRWRVLDEAAGARRVFELVGRCYDPAAATFSASLRISTGVLGEFVMPAAFTASDAEPAPAEAEVAALRRALTLLASSVSEVCEAQASVWRRVHELEALYRLSSVLAQAGDLDELLSTALDLAIDALRADGGSIGVVEPESEQLVMKSARGVSREWMESSVELSSGAALRAAAIRGEVVYVADMQTDERIVLGDLAQREGLVSMLSTGMIFNSRPIGLLRLYTRSTRAFSDVERALLRSIADQAAAAITNARLRVLREEDMRIQRQIRLAADVQRRMLPRTTPDIPRLDVAARYSPSFELGGDFYDFIELGKSFGIVIGDVAGKGVAAALLMSAVRASLRAHAQDVYDIGEVLMRVNAALVRDTRDDEFATVWYGVIEPENLRMTYCGAGHEWPLLIRVPSGRTITDADVQRLTADGMALGIDAAQQYPHGVFTLRPNDILVAFTDGVTDSSDFENRRFGGTRLRRCLVELLAREPAAPASRIVEHVFWQLRQFSGLSRRIDDVTLVVMRIKE